MTEPQAEPPVAPVRRPTLLERLLALWPSLHHAARVEPLFTCSHRWPDGSPAWSACVWNGSGWYSRCARCGLVARCR